MHQTSLADYLTMYGDILLDQVEEAAVPLHNERLELPAHEFLREPFPAQFHRALAHVKTWNSGKRAIILSGATGTGKTLVASISCHLHANGKPYRVLVMCPTHLCRKWAREVQQTIPNAKTFIIQSYKELPALRRAKAPTCPEFYIVSDMKAKLGTPWRASYTLKTATFLDSDGIEYQDKAPACPNCGELATKALNDDQNGERIKLPVSPAELEKRKHSCEECESPLWQWTKRFDRWPITDYIDRYMRRFFDYGVIDECHQARGAKTAIGASAASIMRSCCYVLAGTGTLLSGYAHSIFPMLYRMDAGAMQDMGFEWDDDMKFTERYGRIETVLVQKNEESNNRMSKGGSAKKTIKVRPGILPSLYGDCLLERTTFLQLSDLGVKLPPKDEFLHAIPMDNELSSAYLKLEDEIRNGLANLLQLGSKGAIATLMNTLIGWPDHPNDYGEIGFEAKDPVTGAKKWIHVANPPKLDANKIRNKDQALLDLVKDIVSRGRQCWVYVQMTCKRDVQPRLQRMFQEAGLKCRILRSGSPATDKREEWIEDNADADVIISHPSLVQTGLDFFNASKTYNFCSLIFYQTGFQTDVVRQAGGRAWRIGQDKDCETHFMYYEGTMQSDVASLMASKISAAEAIDGKFSTSGLASMANDAENPAMVLARRLVENTARDKSVDDFLSKVSKYEFGRVQVSRPTLDDVRKSSGSQDRETLAKLEATLPKATILAELATKVTKLNAEPAGEIVIPKARLKSWLMYKQAIEDSMALGELDMVAIKMKRLEGSLGRLPDGERSAIEKAIGFAELKATMESELANA